MSTAEQREYIQDRTRVLSLLVAQMIDYLERLCGIRLYNYQKYEAAKIFRSIIDGSSADMSEL